MKKILIALLLITPVISHAMIMDDMDEILDRETPFIEQNKEQSNEWFPGDKDFTAYENNTFAFNSHDEDNNAFNAPLTNPIQALSNKDTQNNINNNAIVPASTTSPITTATDNSEISGPLDPNTLEKIKERRYKFNCNCCTQILESNSLIHLKSRCNLHNTHFHQQNKNNEEKIKELIRMVPKDLRAKCPYCPNLNSSDLYYTLTDISIILTKHFNNNPSHKKWKNDFKENPHKYIEMVQSETPVLLHRVVSDNDLDDSYKNGIEVKIDIEQLVPVDISENEYTEIEKRSYDIKCPVKECPKKFNAPSGRRLLQSLYPHLDEHGMEQNPVKACAYIEKYYKKDLFGICPTCKKRTKLYYDTTDMLSIIKQHQTRVGCPAPHVNTDIVKKIAPTNNPISTSVDNQEMQPTTATTTASHLPHEILSASPHNSLSSSDDSSSDDESDSDEHQNKNFLPQYIFNREYNYTCENNHQIKELSYEAIEKESKNCNYCLDWIKSLPKDLQIKCPQCPNEIFPKVFALGDVHFHLNNHFVNTHNKKFEWFVFIKDWATYIDTDELPILVAAALPSSYPHISQTEPINSTNNNASLPSSPLHSPSSTHLGIDGFQDLLEEDINSNSNETITGVKRTTESTQEAPPSKKQKTSSSSSHPIITATTLNAPEDAVQPSEDMEIEEPGVATRIYLNEVINDYNATIASNLRSTLSITSPSVADSVTTESPPAKKYSLAFNSNMLVESDNEDNFTEKAWKYLKNNPSDVKKFFNYYATMNLPTKKMNPPLVIDLT